METATHNAAPIEQLVQQAMTRCGLKREADLARYLPDGEYHMHHLSVARLKRTNPSTFAELLKTHIFGHESPKRFPPKPRVRRTLNGNKNALVLPRAELEQVIQKLRTHGENDLVLKLKTIMNPLSSIKKQLIDAIRSDEADDELWASFKLALKSK